jgi:hypothetical protein
MIVMKFRPRDGSQLKYSLRDLMRELQRESAYRRGAYPGLVKREKLTFTRAQLQVEMMEVAAFVLGQMALAVEEGRSALFVYGVTTSDDLFDPFDTLDGGDGDGGDDDDE